MPSQKTVATKISPVFCSTDTEVQSVVFDLTLLSHILVHFCFLKYLFSLQINYTGNTLIFPLAGLEVQQKVIYFVVVFCFV